jgi:hypothetical protein
MSHAPKPLYFSGGNHPRLSSFGYYLCDIAGPQLCPLPSLYNYCGGNRPHLSGSKRP